jgi:hypothetical protein
MRKTICPHGSARIVYTSIYQFPHRIFSFEIKNQRKSSLNGHLVTGPRKKVNLGSHVSGRGERFELQRHVWHDRHPRAFPVRGAA